MTSLIKTLADPLGLFAKDKAAAPTAPTASNSTSQLDAAALAERRAQGRASTVLTGPSLLSDNTASKTLTGA